MNSIVIDLEMNEIDLEQHPLPHKTCRFEVMEIGAVKLDENFNQIDEYKTYIKPQMNPIGERYTQLTGISDETVKDARSFTEAFKEFCEWCGTGYKIISWGGTDKAQIKAECLFKGIEPADIKYMMKNWLDFQALFSKNLGIYKSVGLKDAVNYAGIDAEGDFHDAYWDAKNTASLYRMFKLDFDNLRTVMKPYIESMKKAQAMTFSLGELLKNIDVDSNKA